jgi:hypothetical protein
MYPPARMTSPLPLPPEVPLETSSVTTEGSTPSATMDAAQEVAAPLPAVQRTIMPPSSPATSAMPTPAAASTRIGSGPRVRADGAGTAQVSAFAIGDVSIRSLSPGKPAAASTSSGDCAV